MDQHYNSWSLITISCSKISSLVDNLRKTDLKRNVWVVTRMLLQLLRHLHALKELVHITTVFKLFKFFKRLQ